METRNHDYVVAWTDGASVLQPGLKVQKSRLWRLLRHQRQQKLLLHLAWTRADQQSCRAAGRDHRDEDLRREP